MEKEGKRDNIPFKDDTTSSTGSGVAGGTTLSRFYHTLRTPLSSLVIILFLLPVYLYAAPERIVPLTQGIAEILYFMDEGRNVVGVPEKTSFPELYRKLPKIGPFYRPDIEKILQLRPRYVIGVKFQEQTLIQLRKLGIETLMVKDETIEDIIDSIRSIGAFLGIRRKGNKLARKLEGCIEKLRYRGNHPIPVVAVLDKSSYKFFVASSRSFVGEMIEIAGGKNLVKSSIAYPQISLEELISLKPEVILDLSTTGNFDYGRWLNARIVRINDPLFTIPGPRITEAIKILRRAMGTGEVNISCWK